MKSYVSPQASQQALSIAEGRDPHAITKLAQSFRNGADPWSINKRGVSLLDLCLQDGRHAILSLWADAARRQFHYGLTSSGLSPIAPPAVKNATLAMARNNIHMIDLVGSFVHLTKNDRQFHLRRFLFGQGGKSNPKGAEERFVYQLAVHSSPQRWNAISNTLLLFPNLNNLEVPAYPPLRQHQVLGQETTGDAPDNPSHADNPFVMARLVDEFVTHAPIQVLINHMSSIHHRVNMDWRKNPTLLNRLRHFTDGNWAEHWKDVGVVFSGTDDEGDTLLHHYLRSTPTPMLNAPAIDFLLEHSAPWTARNNKHESCEDLVLLHKGSPLLEPDVAEMFSYLYASNQSFQAAHARLSAKF